MMSMLPAIPVVLLAAVAVWFFWPTVADPISRASTRRPGRSDADSVAETLFDVWSRHGQTAGTVRNAQR